MRRRPVPAPGAAAAWLAAITVAAVVTVTGCGSPGPAASGPPASPAAPKTSPPVSDGDATRLPGVPSATAAPSLPTPTAAPGEARFVSAVFSDAQSEWKAIFGQAGIAYHPAKLVLFSSAVHTGCGKETSRTGPFYCPADQTVYLDLSFFDEMERQFGVTGDFAQAYVVAHELGHHIQLLTGVTEQVARLQHQEPRAANALSVRTELQADCYAGVWAHSTYERKLLEPGDLDEALKAAATVGDDFLQRAATGSVQPEKWTHGSSQQRKQWLLAGYQTGKPADCDTFSSSS